MEGLRDDNCELFIASKYLLQLYQIVMVKLIPSNYQDTNTTGFTEPRDVYAMHPALNGLIGGKRHGRGLCLPGS